MKPIGSMDPQRVLPGKEFRAEIQHAVGLTWRDMHNLLGIATVLWAFVVGVTGVGLPMTTILWHVPSQNHYRPDIQSEGALHYMACAGFPLC
jgi:uncharacterized iron-regulated membrane protein